MYFVVLRRVNDAVRVGSVTAWLLQILVPPIIRMFQIGLPSLLCNDVFAIIMWSDLRVTDL